MTTIGDPFDEAREELRQEAVLRSADPVPAADVAHAVEELKHAVSAFQMNREQVRIARAPELAPDGRSTEVDDDYVAIHERQLSESLLWLRTAATDLLGQLDHERDTNAKQAGQ